MRNLETVIDNKGKKSKPGGSRTWRSGKKNMAGGFRPLMKNRTEGWWRSITWWLRYLTAKESLREDDATRDYKKESGVGRRGYVGSKSQGTPNPDLHYSVQVPV